MNAPRVRSAVAAFSVGLLGTLVLGPVRGQSPGTSPAPDPNGRPKVFQEGKGPAVAVWYDDGWHLALTTYKKSKGDLFTGSVRVDKGLLIGEFDKLEKRKDGKVDWIFPHKDGGGFDFRFTNFGFLDKTRFKAGPGASTMTFDVKVNGQAAPQLVFVGKGGMHPEKVPFTLPAFP